MRTLAEWLELQQAVHARSIDLGLERVAQVASRLGVLRPAQAVITVGGTNGKGSTVAHLEALLVASGVHTGAFTSPHLVRYNERVRIAGEPVSDAELVEAFERIERARGSTTLTFFEFGTLAALLIFGARRVEAALLEVGLGGRLDATNIVDPHVAVVCSIGFDHREWLGDTLEAIGAEKAGILRAGRPAVLGTADMPASVFAAIERLGARPIVAERDFRWHASGERWTYEGRRVRLDALPLPALAGQIQLRNAATALAALEALGVPARLEQARVAAALRAERLPGRFQIVPGPVPWILDVAHNEPAARVLAANLAEHAAAGRTLAVAGLLRDKDVEAIGAALAPHVSAWIACSIPEARGLGSGELAARLRGTGRPIVEAPSVAAGCALAQAQAKPGDRIVAFGSFHTVGPALQFLGLY